MDRDARGDGAAVKMIVGGQEGREEGEGDELRQQKRDGEEKEVVGGSVRVVSKVHRLHDTWTMYYHSQDDKNWALDSYKIIQKNIGTVEDAVFISKVVHENLLKTCMFFVMRSNITPLWEDPKNRNGGCFSFKVLFRFIYGVWSHLHYAIVGETIFSNRQHHSLVNGITISPKKNFCIIKIWLKNCTVQDPHMLTPIQNLSIAGCLFRKHEPEF